MKKYGLTMLLLVCFLISLPVAAVDFRSTEVSNSYEYLQNPGITLNSFPEEITINLRGEVPVMLSFDREIIIYDVINFDIPLLEFNSDNVGKHNLYEKVLTKGTLVNIIYYNSNNTALKYSGGADLFCLIKQSVFQML